MEVRGLRTVAVYARCSKTDVDPIGICNSHRALFELVRRGIQRLCQADPDADAVLNSYSRTRRQLLP